MFDFLPGFSENPVIHIDDWQLYEDETGGICVAGVDAATQAGHTSAHILNLDIEQGYVRAETGQSFCLHGKPGLTSAADDIWIRRCNNYGLPIGPNITDEILQLETLAVADHAFTLTNQPTEGN